MDFRKLLLVPAVAVTFALGACADDEPMEEGIGVAEEEIGVMDEGLEPEAGVLQEEPLVEEAEPGLDADGDGVLDEDEADVGVY